MSESTFEVWLDGDENKGRMIDAPTAGKAKYRYVRSLDGICGEATYLFRRLRSRRIGAAAPVPPSLQSQLILCAAWMGRIGARVLYFPVLGAPEFRETMIASEPWVLSGHTAVIRVEGVSGCVAIANIREALAPAAVTESEVAA